MPYNAGHDLRAYLYNNNNAKLQDPAGKATIA